MDRKREAMRTLSGQTGATLMELIVGMTLGAILIAATFQLHTNFIKSNTALKNESVLQEHLARANQFLEKDIRMAGYNIRGNGLVVDLSVPDQHVLHLLRNDDNSKTALASAAAVNDQTVLVNEAAQAGIGKWACFAAGADIGYHTITHVGINASGADTLTLSPALSRAWDLNTPVDLAVGYSYALEISGNVKSFVRRTNNDSYAITDQIDGIAVTVRDSSGGQVVGDFKQGRTVVVQLSSLIDAVNSSQKTVTNIVEAGIRNPQ